MNFRLAVVGHSSSVEELTRIAEATFDNVEITGIPFSSDEMITETVNSLRPLLPRLDGVLYTRKDPYKLIVSRHNHAGVLARFVDIDASSFVHSLFIAANSFRADIRRVSVDALDYSTIMRTYESLGIPSESVRPVIVNVDTNAEHFVEAAAQAHRESYQSGLCGVCLTNIRNVWDSLAAEGIPCVLMTPSRENYLNEIRRLMLQHTEEQAKGSAAVIRIRAELSSNYYLHQKTMVQNVLDLGRLAEYVVLFAQRVSGMFARIGEQDFAIACGREEIVYVTERFTRLELLEQIYSNTPYRLAVGIGTGVNLQTASANAELGTQRAWVEGCNRAYLVHAENNEVGPIQPNELLHTTQPLFDQHLTKAARDCALSINTIFRIDTFVRRKNNGTFIIAELARELHVSFRTGARIVEKLEKNGYIVEIGRSVINGRGRPTRVFRLLW